jgi:hypothetical protein
MKACAQKGSISGQFMMGHVQSVSSASPLPNAATFPPPRMHTWVVQVVSPVSIPAAGASGEASRVLSLGHRRRRHGLPPLPPRAAGSTDLPPPLPPPPRYRHGASAHCRFCLGQRGPISGGGGRGRHAEEGRAPGRRLGAPAPPAPRRRGASGQGAALDGGSRYWWVATAPKSEGKCRWTR